MTIVVACQRFMTPRRVKNWRINGFLWFLSLTTTVVEACQTVLPHDMSHCEVREYGLRLIAGRRMARNRLYPHCNLKRIPISSTLGAQGFRRFRQFWHPL